MNSRNAGILAVVALAVGLGVPAARAQQAHVEKIPLRYIDVRTVAALLGAPVLPNELELAQQRSLGGGLAPGYGYGAGYGPSPYGGVYDANRLMGAYSSSRLAPGYASSYAQDANARAPWFAQGGAPGYAQQPGIIADPRTNSLITGR